MNCGGIFDVESKKTDLLALEERLKNPDVWGRPQEMQKLNKQKSILEKSIGEFESLVSRLDDTKVLLELAVESNDEDSFSEVKNEVAELQKLANQLELAKMLSGELDANSAFISINSGAGGTEACDWADMLMRMYVRYAEQNGFRTEVLEISDGEGAGIKSATLNIQGNFAYGFLKAETGVHRLVRISPFDSNARRHTSFASVFAWPEVDDDIEIEIRSEDLKIDTYRSGGAGGQHVNKTESAVRITHLPTGIVVQCQTQRSQHANKDKAMKMLKAAMYERQVEEKERAKKEMSSGKKANEWGSQIRSYVLHPYQLVKDHRTLHETSQSQSVLDGDLQDFIVSYLKFQTSGTTSGSPDGKNADL